MLSQWPFDPGRVTLEICPETSHGGPLGPVSWRTPSDSHSMPRYQPLSPRSARSLLIVFVHRAENLFRQYQPTLIAVTALSKAIKLWPMFSLLLLKWWSSYCAIVTVWLVCVCVCNRRLDTQQRVRSILVCWREWGDKTQRSIQYSHILISTQGTVLLLLTTVSTHSTSQPDPA